MAEKVTKINGRARSHAMGIFRILQITDCHLGSEPHERLLGLDTDQSLHDVLVRAKATETPDLIINTGDISNDGGPVSYARFLTIVEHYFPGVPVAWMPGNHDNPENMIAVGRHPIELDHQVAGWNLIFLDSRIPREEGGRLGEAELARLSRELEAHSNLPTIVFLHHQPVPVKCEWVDQYVILDADAFFAIIDQHPQVKMISWGHVHQEFRSIRNGVELVATPSTCVQFLPESKTFKLDTQMPGYRAYELHENGDLRTSVRRSEAKGYDIDMTATGY